MAYFFDELDFLVGGRLTDLGYTSDRLWPADLDDEIVVLGQYLQLPRGQHVELEEDFLGSHLPFRRASFGGRDIDDDPWLFMLQAVPRSVVTDVHGPDADSYEVMRESMSRALSYNFEAEIGPEGEWTRADLIGVYAASGIERTRIDRWTTFELLRGLLAELTGVPLRDLVAGYPDCTFPGVQHTCEHDVFRDAFVAWTRGGEGGART